MYKTITVGEYADYLERIAARMREVEESRPTLKIMEYTTVTPIYPASREDMLDMAHILNITPEFEEYRGRSSIRYDITNDGAYARFWDMIDNQPADAEQETAE